MAELGRRSALMLSIAALAVAGCNDDEEPQQGRLSSSDYQAAILDLLEESSAPTGLYFDLVTRPRPEQECATVMNSFHDEVKDLVERFAALEPPSNVDRVHGDFVGAASQSVVRLGEINAKVAAGRVSCGPQLNDLLYGMPSTSRAEQAISELENHGYFVGGE